MSARLVARTTGVLRGRRIYHERKFDRVVAIEPGFSPGAGERPAQARIWHEVWEPRLHRYDLHVDLVVLDDVRVDDLAAEGVRLYGVMA